MKKQVFFTTNIIFPFWIYFSLTGGVFKGFSLILYIVKLYVTYCHIYQFDISINSTYSRRNIIHKFFPIILIEKRLKVI